MYGFIGEFDEESSKNGSSVSENEEDVVVNVLVNEVALVGVEAVVANLSFSIESNRA
jgi:hypothetical protein